jgi:hypothetical protein
MTLTDLAYSLKDQYTIGKTAFYYDIYQKLNGSFYELKSNNYLLLINLFYSVQTLTTSFIHTNSEIIFILFNIIVCLIGALIYLIPFRGPVYANYFMQNASEIFKIMTQYLMYYIGPLLGRFLNYGGGFGGARVGYQVVNGASIEQPQSTQSESTQPESTQPESTQPESTQPESTQPESTQPQLADLLFESNDRSQSVSSENMLNSNPTPTSTPVLSSLINNSSTLDSTLLDQIKTTLENIPN